VKFITLARHSGFKTRLVDLCVRVNYTRVREERRIFRPVWHADTNPSSRRAKRTVCESLVNSDMSFFSPSLSLSLRRVCIYSKSRCTASERSTRAFKTRLSSRLKGFSERLYSHSSQRLSSKWNAWDKKIMVYVWVMVIILSDWLRRASGWVWDSLDAVNPKRRTCIHKKNVAHIRLLRFKISQWSGSFTLRISTEFLLRRGAAGVVYDFF
jgi:hypothetical protein